MIRREHVALLTIALVLIGLPVAVFGYEFGLRPSTAAHRVIDVTAAAPEAGGFQPAHVEVAVEEARIRHRFEVRHRAIDQLARARDTTEPGGYRRFLPGGPHLTQPGIHDRLAGQPVPRG